MGAHPHALSWKKDDSTIHVARHRRNVTPHSRVSGSGSPRRKAAFDADKGRFFQFDAFLDHAPRLLLNARGAMQLRQKSRTRGQLGWYHQRGGGGSLHANGLLPSGFIRGPARVSAALMLQVWGARLAALGDYQMSLCRQTTRFCARIVSVVGGRVQKWRRDRSLPPPPAVPECAGLLLPQDHAIGSSCPPSQGGLPS